MKNQKRKAPVVRRVKRAAKTQSAVKPQSQPEARKAKKESNKFLLTSFITSWLFILSVAAYDMYWSIRLKSMASEMEQNPIGRWLISLDNGDVALFMALKCVGVAITLTALILMFSAKQKTGCAVIFVIALAQLALLTHLNGWLPWTEWFTYLFG